jgi:hypothetical protein
MAPPGIEWIDGADKIVVEEDQILSATGLISNAGARFEALGTGSEIRSGSHYVGLPSHAADHEIDLAGAAFRAPKAG